MHKKKNAPTTQPAESWQLESRDTSGCWCLHHFLQKIESNCRRIIYWELYLNGLLSSCLAVSSRGWTGCKHETMSKATVVTTKSSWGAASSFTWISAPALAPCSPLCWCDQLCSGAINWSGQKLPWLLLPWVTLYRAELSDLALCVAALGDELRAPWVPSCADNKPQDKDKSAPGAGTAPAGMCEPAAFTAPQFQQPALCVELRWKGASWTSAFPNAKSTFKTSLVVGYMILYVFLS